MRVRLRRPHQSAPKCTITATAPSSSFATKLRQRLLAALNAVLPQPPAQVTTMAEFTDKFAEIKSTFSKGLDEFKTELHTNINGHIEGLAKGLSAQAGQLTTLSSSLTAIAVRVV